MRVSIDWEYAGAAMNKNTDTNAAEHIIFTGFMAKPPNWL
jgi:hypothetical protein